MSVWRRSAAAAGLSVDVWIALKLEWSLIRADATDRGRLDAVVEHARRNARTARQALVPASESYDSGVVFLAYRASFSG
jgi:hypothetical protein